ncbi:hypothetical protein NLU13_9445 [Sarocladium strictum]|uniref:dolichol kinase n=1 Tax=Sarocladium strictum TaxID=5046 RepID=A0AA39GAR4_SARSR|nr:hypothetical protein NLU13_9445 [Sarocladium strictum]
MPAHLSPDVIAVDPDEQDHLRPLNRSPHPYHHQSYELPHPSDRFQFQNSTARASKAGGDLDEGESPGPNGYTKYPDFSKESTPGSESGTEADDEHFLKGLPAPKARLHKGLRGRNEPLSGSGSPLPSPSIREEDETAAHEEQLRAAVEKARIIDILRRNKNLSRRATEAGILAALGGLVASNLKVTPLVSTWSKDLQTCVALYVGLLILYPLRVITWHHRKQPASSSLPLKLPHNFDPAPLLYPPAITLFVAFLVATDTPSVILPNVILALSSIPQQLIPTVDRFAPYDPLHWLIACGPLVRAVWTGEPVLGLQLPAALSEETLVLLYPIHQTLCGVLHHLTTTSLLIAELQLLSIGLINVLLLAVSPQIKILKSLLWVGGLAILVSCGGVIRSGITLARVPRWRFRPATTSSKPTFWRNLYAVITWRRKTKHDLLGPAYDEGVYDTPCTSDGEAISPTRNALTRVRTLGLQGDPRSDGEPSPSSPESPHGYAILRRHTLAHPDGAQLKRNTHTPSGRRKRATSVSVRPFLRLTYTQAVMRKWFYASYVYICMALTIVFGIRVFIQQEALNGEEPIGWGLGYAFGELPWFRFKVVNANLERWICLPPRTEDGESKHCDQGIAARLRHDLGEANTRLAITGYWFVIFVTGLMVVFRLKDIYEVDTRRKVFHFMMVGMLLPATFVDPTFAALVLFLVLAVFLILDLLRASQLPPLSKPIAAFLAPYVDGRDFRGPVVISHIFLLIGCAIPLWLSLASLPRTGSGYLAGWEVPTRDVSMVAGVVCVGLGDAAASLIGRRYGHRKWLWGGGKSIEGSVAFAVAVFFGLAAAGAWLHLGGWVKSGDGLGPVAYVRNTAFCASIASVTEAVLTGGNDNVIVPVVLWTCVKALDV